MTLFIISWLLSGLIGGLIYWKVFSFNAGRELCVGDVLTICLWMSLGFVSLLVFGWLYWWFIPNPVSPSRILNIVIWRGKT